MSTNYLEQQIRKIVDQQLQGHLQVHHTDGNEFDQDRIENEAFLCCDEVSSILRQARVDLILRGSV
jgi:hypothetical protein